jgi:hydroxymethylglutaryl-CoA reductase
MQTMNHIKAPSSRIAGFYKLSVDERLAIVREFADLTDEEVAELKGTDEVRLAQADKMIENVTGLFHLPVGFAANFRIDGRDVLVPMVIEEASVVAASSNGAKLLRNGPGIVTDASDPLMIGQIQLCGVPDMAAARKALEKAAEELIERANAVLPGLVARGGGARRITVRELHDPELGVEPMMVVHVVVDVCDAMGANMVNEVVENLAPTCEKLTGGQAYLRILSNLADQRLVSAVGRIPVDWLSRPGLGYDGAAVASRVEQASLFAEVDPYRAATHNKGIMNGIDAFMLATGQDWRAIEAGAHAYVARSGRYGAMATWRYEADSHELVGRLKIPMQVGTVGGVTQVHPVVKVLLKVIGGTRASDLGRIAASVGLAQNLAAIMTLATEGIQRGHMSLHARNIAAAIGAKDEEIDRVVAEMIRRRTFTHDMAATIYQEHFGDHRAPPEPEAEPSPFGYTELRDLRDRYWPETLDFIASVIPRQRVAPGSLDDMIWYQLNTGGKRFRAIIPIAVFQALRRPPREVIPFAAAMELLHNATLIHDAAADRLRTLRDHDALWVRYGVDQAISCGDALFYQALKCLEGLRPAPPAPLSSTVVDHMLRVIRAQVDKHRLDQVGQKTDRLELARDRIGGLLSLCVAGSAMLAGADRETLDKLQTLGGHLGIIFLVQNDLLGIVGGRFGVRRGESIAAGQVTLLTAHCLDKASPEVRAELINIISKSRSDTTPQDISRAIGLLYDHGSFDYAMDLIETQRGHVERLSEGTRPELVRLLVGLADVFLVPLMLRVGSQ